MVFPLGDRYVGVPRPSLAVSTERSWVLGLTRQGSAAEAVVSNALSATALAKGALVGALDQGGLDFGEGFAE